MTTSQELLEVGVRLEEAVERIPGKPANALELHERLESTAIAISDSEHENWPEGVLSSFLLAYLSEQRRELGLLPSQLK